jgi:hypothetical protein
VVPTIQVILPGDDDVRSVVEHAHALDVELAQTVRWPMSSPCSGSIVSPPSENASSG